MRALGWDAVGEICVNCRDMAVVVSRLSPGMRLTVNHGVLQDLQAPPGWTTAAWILESIIGSAYEYSYTEDVWTGSITFERLPHPLTDGRIASISADRQHLMEQDADGYWIPRRGKE